MMPWKNNHPKPIIGIVGGIGAGKSAIAALFANEGCAAIDSDRLVHEILHSHSVKTTLTEWLGPSILDPQGNISRPALGAIVFQNPSHLERLNHIIHPEENQRRNALTTHAMANPAIKAIVWDTPLLFETGLNRDCDATVFVEVPRELRLERLTKTRSWGPQELDRREKMQMPLDKKADLADYCINNSGDPVASQHQVHQVLSRLLSSPSG